MQRGPARDAEEWPSARRESWGSSELELVFAAPGFAGHVRARRSAAPSGELGWDVRAPPAGTSLQSARPGPAQ